MRVDPLVGFDLFVEVDKYYNDKALPLPREVEVEGIGAH
jgi:hypothetical protein